MDEHLEIAGSVDPTSTDDAGPALFHWTDGTSKEWRIEASPDRLVLDDDEERYDFSRSTWRDAITFSPLGSRVVIHFDTGSREIGFLVPQTEARALFAALAEQEAPTPAASEPVVQARPADHQGPLWPKMTAMPVVALCLSAVAFVPFAGLLFGIAAIVLALLARKRARANASFAHVRAVALIALVFSVVGIGVCAVGSYAMVDRLSTGEIGDQLFGEPVEWSTGAIVAAIVMVIIALSFHEAGHAITAWWSGDGYAKSIGRVTLNPLAHIDPLGTVVLPIMLAVAHLPVFGYAKPVPVRLGHVRHWRRAHILISAAGPLSNLLQAAVCLELLLLIGAILALTGAGAGVANFSSLEPIVEIKGFAGAPIVAGIALMLKLGFQVNVMLAFFNMLPIPPLDGSWIAEHLSPAFIGQFYARIRPFGFVIFIGLLYAGILDYLLAPAFYVLGFGHILVALVSGM